jgi:hypothetical protein
MSQIANYINIAGLSLDAVGVVLIGWNLRKLAPDSRRIYGGKWESVGWYILIFGFVLQIIAQALRL